MNATKFTLAKAPIVEAVVDIDCDMPATFDLAGIEVLARDAFRSHYPTLGMAFVEHHHFMAAEEQPPVHSAQRAVQAFQFRSADKKQLVQVRSQGFSFNRLTPYANLEEYLPEIERAWRIFLGLALPVNIRAIRLRYINRIFLPLKMGEVQLDDFLKIAPRLPDELKLTFAGFLNQHAAVEGPTGHRVNIVLASELGDGKWLPVIFDNTVEARGPSGPDDWEWILGKIEALRELKNRVFREALTDKCLDLFR